MGELMKKLKRSLAALLAVCVVITSIPHIAWAAENEAEDPLLTAEDVMASAELKLVPEDAPIPYAELTERAQTAIRTTAPADLSSMLTMALEKDRSKYRETFSGTLFRVGQYGDPATTCVVVFVRPAEEQESYDTYTMTGTEKFIFLYVNQTDTDYNMKINIQDYNAQIVTVPSVSTLYTLYSNEKKSSPSNAEEKNSNPDALNSIGGGSGNGGAAAQEMVASETAPDGETEETTERESQPSEVVEEETEASSEESVTEPVTAAAEEISTEKTEAIDTDEEETSTNAMAEDTESEVKIVDESEAKTEEAPDVTSGEDLIAPEALTLSRSYHAVPVLGSGNVAPVEGEVYEGEAENPAQEYNMKMGRDRFDDGEEEDAEDYSYTEDYEGPIERYAEYTATVVGLSGLLEDETKASPSDASPSNATPSNRILMSRSARSRSQIMGAVGYSEEQVTRESRAESGTFQVSFYDYVSHEINQYPNKAILKLPGSNSNKLLIGDQPGYGNQNRWIGSILNVEPPNDNIVTQGIAKDKYDSDGRIQFNYTTGPIFGKSGAGGNPDMTGITKFENVKVSEDVNPFFTHDRDGNFVFDSNNRNAALQKKTDATGNVSYTLEGTAGDSKGFFPLNGYNNTKNPTYDKSNQNLYFGMTLSFNFFLPEGGKITTPQGYEKNMVFDFTGDDDVWVYLRKADSKEGRLALDLGGIHGASGGRIDFATGLITHDKVWTGKTSGQNRTKTVYWYLYDDKAVNDRVGGHVIDKVVGLPKDAWSEYTLDFYYMERGGNVSNCKIQANMPTIPQDKVAVFKSVAGEAADDKFTMELQTKDHEGIWQTIESKKVEKNQKIEFDAELPQNTEYRVVESENSAPATRWKVGDATAEGLTSPIGIVGVNNLAVCFNNYDFSPTIRKEAIQEQEEQDLYWIDLGIKGNSTVQETIEGDTTTEKTYYIDSVNVEDQLTNWVEFELKENVPQIRLQLKKSGDGELKDLPVTTTQVGEDQYQVFYNDHRVATIDGKAIIWAAVNKDYKFGNFDENSEVVLSYLVRVSDDAEYKEDTSEYPDTANAQTGTHSSENGYYSNVYATAEYTTELFTDAKKLNFKKPVVRPLKPQGSLTITKEIESDIDAQNVAFGFTVNLKKVRVKSFLAGKSGTTLQAVETQKDGTAQLEFSLKAGESYEIRDLNRETEYIIKEERYSDTEHYSDLINVTVTPKAGSVTNLESREVSGSLTDSAGTEKEYSYVESTSVDSGTNEVHYGDSQIVAELGKDGWYGNGVWIQPGTEKYYKVIEGTVPKETEPGKTIYTWLDDENKVIASSEDDGIEAAQDKVVEWLKERGYTEEISREDEEPFAVTASKKDIVEEKLYQIRYFLGGWQWYDDKTDTELKKFYEDRGYTVDDHVQINTINPYKRELIFKFYKLESNPRTPQSSTEGGTTFWPWDGTNYSSQSELIKSLENDGYTTKVNQSDDSVSYSKSVQRNDYEMFQAGYRKRVYSSKDVTIPASKKALQVGAVFTNSFEQKESFTVQKVIDAPSNVNPDETYRFKVYKYDENTEKYVEFTKYVIEPAEDTNAEKVSGDSVFTITGEGAVTIFIDEDSKNGTYQIEEVDRGTANAVTWDDDRDGSKSKAVKNGDTAVCTNHYFNNTLSISKKLSADSYVQAPDEAKWFKYTVTLKDSEGKPLNKIKYQKNSSHDFSIAEENKGNEEIILNKEDGSFQFSMMAGGSLVLENIPNGVTYTVTEGSFDDSGSNTYYVSELTKVMKNGEEIPADTDGTISSSVEGSFPGNEQQNEALIYTNRISPKKTDITITKSIVDKNGSAVTNDGEGETFIFEIKNGDPNSPGYGEMFYATIVIKDGKGEITIHGVFASNSYEVKEMDNMRFKPYQGKSTASINATGNDGSYTVGFMNYRESSGYFTDTDVAINKVTADGFERQSSQAPEGAETTPEALPLAVLKHDEILFGEGTFDSEEIPYYGL